MSVRRNNPFTQGQNIENDWNFGNGQSDYLTGNDEVAQNIKTRLLSFLGNCFFEINAGIDWFNLIGSKNTIALNLAINAVILNTPNVTGILETSFSLSDNRVFSVTFKVQTTYSTTNGTAVFDVIQ